MVVSVIIPTYQGAGVIVFLLEALKKQSYHNFEVIVVIDGSTDNTRDVLRNTTFEHLKLTVIDQKNQGRAAARNAGAKRSNGDILVFFDDDTIPFSDCIERHVNFHIKNTKRLLFGNAIQYISESSSDFEIYRAFLSEKWIKNFPEHAVKLTPDNLFLMAANFSIHKNVHTALAGFDNALSDAEDLDLGVRAYKAGFDIFFDRSINVFHNEKITCSSYVLRQRQYAQANAIVRARHNDFFKSQNQTPGLFAKVIYYILSFKPIVTWIDGGLFAVFLPKKMRYTLYGAVIFSLSQLHQKKITSNF